MNWEETTSSLVKLRKDFEKCSKYLRDIDKPETFPECERKMKSAAERIKVLEIVHKRVVNRFNRLYLFMGMTIDQAKEQKVINFL